MHVVYRRMERRRGIRSPCHPSVSESAMPDPLSGFFDGGFDDAPKIIRGMSETGCVINLRGLSLRVDSIPAAAFASDAGAVLGRVGHVSLKARHAELDDRSLGQFLAAVAAGKPGDEILPWRSARISLAHNHISDAGARTLAEFSFAKAETISTASTSASVSIPFTTLWAVSRPGSMRCGHGARCAISA
jgi:hypothetical protein